MIRSGIDCMKRRDFITLVGGAAAWPLVARAQQAERARRIGVLIGPSENDPVFQSVLTAFRDALAKLGWIEGCNLSIDLRFGESDAGRIRTQAADLVRLGPDVIYTVTGPATLAVQRQTKTIPIVFEGGGGSPPVTNIARPEGNTTGFANSIDSIGEKFVELLKEVAPGTKRIGFISNPDSSRATISSYVPSIKTAAQALAIKIIDLPFRDAAELERGLVAFAAEPNGGLILGPLTTDRELIFRLATQHRLPSVAQTKVDAREGSLITYAADPAERPVGAATYVDRILHGAKPADLPVQFPRKFELTINLKTATALGLNVPLSLQQRADEVIE
jgi:putative tryptophan/tyrosine transport system substrate-binding protein